MSDLPYINGLEKICKIFANIFKGDEIGRLIKKCNIVDVNPEETKWKRFYAALSNKSNQNKSSDCAYDFIQKSMHPVQWEDGDKDVFEATRNSINNILRYEGLELSELGQIQRVNHGASGLKDAKFQNSSDMNRQNDNNKDHKVFISHSSKDAAYIDPFVKLLKDMELKGTDIICSSVPGYDIPIDEDIYDWLSSQSRDYSLHVIFFCLKTITQVLLH